MASAARQIAMRLSIEDAQKVRDFLRGMGEDGKAALSSLETGAARAAPAMRQVTTAAEDSGRGIQAFGSRIGQAGYQLQDFVVQIQSGQSALVALSQQGSQFLGAFGTGGAIAGAVLTVGILAAQLLGAADNGKKFTDSIEAQERGLKAALSAANDWRNGLETEARQVRDLTTYYASLSEQRRQLERRSVQRDQEALQDQLNTFASDQVGRLQNLPETLGMRVRDIEGQANLYPAGSEERQALLASPDLARLRSDYEEAQRIVSDFTKTVTTDGANTSEALAQIVARLREMAESASAPAARELNRVIDALEKAAPRAQQLSEASEQLNARLEALGLRNIAAANGLDALAAAASRAQAKLADLQAVATQTTAAPERALANAQALLSTLERQGTKAAEALQRQQTAAESLDGRVRAQLSAEESAQRAVIKAQAEALNNDGKREEAVSLLREGEARLFDQRRQREPEVRRQLEETDRAVQTYANRRQEIAKREQEAEAAATRARSAARSAERKEEAEAARERDAALRVQAEFYNSPTMTRSGLLSIGTMDDKLIQQIQQSIRGTAWDPDKRQKDLDDATKAAQRSYEKQQQQAERTYDRIADYAGDRLADLFLDTEGGWKKTMENLRKTAVSTFARIAAEALLRPIVMPIVQQFTGGGSGSTVGTAAALALSATQTPGSTPVVQNGSLMGWAQQGSQAYSLYSKISGDGAGLSMFSPSYDWTGNSIVGGVDNFLGTGIGDWLNSPLYGGISASQTAATNTALAGMGEGVYGPATAESVAAAGGSAAGTGGSIAGAIGGGVAAIGGAYAAYQGVQRGGVGGYTQAAGGAAMAGMGAYAAIAGSMAAVPVYGWIAAAVLMVLGALLPGQKPSDKTGTATLYTLSDELTEGGLDGARRSQENRDAAKNIAEAIGSLATNIGQATGLNGPVAAGLTVSVGNRDGVDIQGLYGPKLEAGKLDEDNVKMLMNAATSRLLIMAGQQTPDEDIRKVIQNSGTDDAATIMANLQWYNDTYKKMSVTAEEAAASTNAFAQSMASLRQPYNEVIEKAQALGLATTELAARQQEATDKLIADRDRQVASILQAADDRVLVSSGGDTLARQLQEFYRQQDAARVAAADQVRALGAGEDVVNRLLSTLVQAAEIEAGNLRNQDAISKGSAQLGALQTLGNQGAILTGFLDMQAVSAVQSPQNAFTSAQEQYARALASARASDPEDADLTSLTRAAGTLLTANSAFYGEGAEGAMVRNGVLSQLRSVGAELNLPQFSEQYAAATDRMIAAQNDNGAKLREVTEALNDLREEFRSYRLSNMR